MARKKPLPELERRQRQAAHEAFSGALEACGCRAEAVALADRVPAEGAPGYELFANFRMFLLYSNMPEYATPNGASSYELLLYVNLVRKMADRNEVPREQAEAIIARLQRDATERP